MLKSVIYTALLTLVLVSCGTDDKHFRLEGRLLNLRQGEFIVYSPDGAMGTIDTLKVVGSRFDLTTECLAEGTAVIVMPNGSEVPVFVEPGASLTMNGDAQNLEMVEVTGTKANEVMNEFRRSSAGKSRKGVPPVVLDIIKKYPGEITTGLYLIRNYLLTINDYDDASKAVDVMLDEQEDNSTLTALRAQLKEMKGVEKGSDIPAFSVKTVDGKIVSASQLRKGIAVVVGWASWNYESSDLLRRIIEKNSQPKDEGWGGVVTIMAISFDADPSKSKITLADNDNNTSWYNVCDGNMVDGHLAHLFSISQVPTIIIVKDGKIVERNIIDEKAIDKIKELTK